MSEGQPEPQAPKTVNLEGKGLRSNGRKSTLSAFLHRRYIQDGCVLASAAEPDTRSGPSATGQAPKVFSALTTQAEKMNLKSDGLIKATHQLQIHSRSSAPASNTARDRDAAVQGALPQSLTPVMPHPGLLLTHPTAEPSPVRGSAPSSSPAVASYPESTLPLPPVLKAHQTSRHRRRTPPLTVSPQAHNPLHSPLLGQAGADELLSLARQYGACIDRREPKRPKQELSAKKSDGAHRPAAAGVYNFLGASIVPKNDLQLAREWVHQTVSTARKCSPPRDSAGQIVSNAKDTAVSKRSIRNILKARQRKSKKKRCIALHH